MVSKKVVATEYFMDLLDTLLEGEVEKLTQLCKPKKVDEFLSRDYDTEEQIMFVPKTPNETNALELSPACLFAHASVGNIKLLKAWSRIKDVNPHYLAMLGLFSGLYIAASTHKNDEDRVIAALGPLAVEGNKFIKNRGGKKPGKVSQVIEKCFCDLMNIDGKLPATKDVFSILPENKYIGTKTFDDNDQPECLSIRDSVNKAWGTIEYKAFVKRVGRIRKKYKSSI